MNSFSLLYLPTPQRQRPALLRGTWDVSCERVGSTWKLHAPGNWTCRGEMFEPEPAFIDHWLQEALKPFGGKPGDGIHLLEGDEAFRAFVKSLEPVLCARSRWPWAAPSKPANELSYLDFDRLSTAFPEDPLLRLERARLAQRTGRPEDEVSGDVAAALALREDGSTLLAASEVYAESDAERRLALLARAITVEPTHDGASTSYMHLLQMAGRFEEALAVDAGRAAKWGRDHNRWFLRANMLVKLGRLAEAVEAFAQSLALHDNALIRALRGTLLVQLGRDDEALRELDAALPHTADFDGRLARADVLIRRGDLVRAEQELRWLMHAPSHRAAAEERLRLLPSAPGGDT